MADFLRADISKRGRLARYIYRNQTASLTAGTVTGDTINGFGDFNQLVLRVEVATVSGGSDAYDCKVQTKLGNTWVDIAGLAVAQMTAADTETVSVVRSATVWWSDEIRVVEVVASGATATLIDVAIYGAVS